MLNWKIEVRKVRKQEIPLKKCNELFVFYLSRAVFPRHIAYFTHSEPVGYVPGCGCHGNGPRGKLLQRDREEEEIENESHYCLTRQNTWHNEICWIYTFDINNKRNHIKC